MGDDDDFHCSYSSTHVYLRRYCAQVGAVVDRKVSQDWLIIEQVCERLRCAPETVYNRMRQGLLTPTKEGVRLYFDTEEVAKLASCSLTISMVQRQLRMSRKEVKAWVEAGKLSHLMIGKVLYIAEEDVTRVGNMRLLYNLRITEAAARYKVGLHALQSYAKRGAIRSLKVGIYFYVAQTDVEDVV